MFPFIEVIQKIPSLTQTVLTPAESQYHTIIPTPQLPPAAMLKKSISHFAQLLLVYKHLNEPHLITSVNQAITRLTNRVPSRHNLAPKPLLMESEQEPKLSPKFGLLWQSRGSACHNVILTGKHPQTQVCLENSHFNTLIVVCL